MDKWIGYVSQLRGAAVRWAREARGRYSGFKVATHKRSLRADGITIALWVVVIKK